jgi:hypothetical protein
VTSLFDEVPGIFVLRVSFSRYSILPVRGRFPANALRTSTSWNEIMEKFDTGEPGGYRRAIDSQQHRGRRGLLERERRSPAYQGLNGSCAVVVIWTKRGEKAPP